MREKFNEKNSNYGYIDEIDIKKLSDEKVIEKIQSTYKVLRLCEIYLKDVKDDYGKKKIASLRVDFLHHQLDLLMRECLSRGIKHGLGSYYSIG